MRSPLPLRIVSLREDDDRLTALACLHHEEWSNVSPFKTIAEHEKKLRGRIGDRPPPATYIFLIDDEIAGSVSLLRSDDIAQVRLDLSPWLASLFVVPKYRGRGFGRELVTHCVDRARQLRFSNLYLYTHTHPEFYGRLGWRAIENCTVRGAVVTVMQLPLLARTTEKVS